MIETPLFGRFYGENKRLVFAAPAPYQVLVKGCLIGGPGMFVVGVGMAAFSIEGPLYPEWWLGVGALVTLAGMAAAFSLTNISFDLIERRYRRRQGPGLFVKTRIGSLNELDALVLIAEPNSQLLAGGITYHLVLHWRGEAQPIMVLQQDSRMQPGGQPMNLGGQQLLSLGLNYAKALGIPFYDNSHFASKCPVPVWK